MHLSFVCKMALTNTEMATICHYLEIGFGALSHGDCPELPTYYYSDQNGPYSS